MCGENTAPYPEDEVEEEKHVLDTFGAAFDSHGAPVRSGRFSGAGLTGRRAAAGQVSRRVTGWISTGNPD